jgi:indole-3-glycerol phosphate synthase
MIATPQFILTGLQEHKSELTAERGVRTRDDVERLISVGVRAVLIGQTLCEHADIAEKFSELFG